MTKLSGGAAACRLDQAPAQARHPAARRPTNHLDVEWSPGSALPQEYAGCIMLVATTVDNISVDAELDRGRACPTRATIRAGWERRQSALETEKGQEEAKRTQARAGMDQVLPKRGRPSRARIQAYDSWPRRPAGNRLCRRRSDPAVRGWAGWWWRWRLSKAFGDRLIDNLSFKRRQRHRRRHRPQRRGQDHALQDDHGAEKTDGGASGLATGEARLRRPEPRSPQRQEDCVEEASGRARRHEARRQDGGELRAYVSWLSTSRDRTSRRRWGLVRRRGTACTWPRC